MPAIVAVPVVWLQVSVAVQTCRQRPRPTLQRLCRKQLGPKYSQLNYKTVNNTEVGGTVVVLTRLMWPYWVLNGVTAVMQYLVEVRNTHIKSVPGSWQAINKYLLCCGVDMPISL